MHRFLWIPIVLLLPFSGCTCADEADGWELTEEFEEEVEEEEESADGGGVFEPDVREEERTDAGWLPEQIEPSVPIEHALNERTALAVDDDGTIWLGYHRCQTQNCSEVRLVLARKPRGGSWSFEAVKEQRGTFGIDVAVSGEPIAAFLDPTDNTFKVAKRTARGEFRFWNLGVRRSGIADGLDLARDGERMFVTFANRRGDPVALFVYAQGEWRTLDTLDIGRASAAYERGLKSDDQGNLYLVHRDGELGPWGVARYSLQSGSWMERTYFDETPLPRPSSMTVSPTREICISSDVQSRYLSVTCGDMVDLDREKWVFDDEAVPQGAGAYSSMVRGTDGSLYVVFPSEGNTVLRLGDRSPSDRWQFETVFEKNAYGVSSVIDSQNLLVISYYTCNARRCALEVISREQP